MNVFLRKSLSYSFLSLTLLFLSSCSYGARSPSPSTRTQIPATQRPYVINHTKYYPIPSSAGYVDTGIASWYGRKFHGRRTSNGERYDMYAETAAHKTLPMNTMLLVKNLENGREMVVRINDRGPFVRGRILDLSYGSARKLGIIQKGTAKVRITAMASSQNGMYANVPDYNVGEFYVQIGAFKEKRNALRLQGRFTSAGHTVVIKEYLQDNNTYYRVQVYTGTQLQLAKIAEEALLKKGYIGAFTVAN
jgi:rare lipoprotein A